jgi:hypothetical protein
MGVLGGSAAQNTHFSVTFPPSIGASGADRWPFSLLSSEIDTENMNHPESKERYLFFGISVKNGLFAGALRPQTIHF